MTTDTIFGSEKSATTESTTTPTKTEEKGLFAALVGETQKYKTPDELAKAYANADQFIAQLKEENRLLREKEKQAKTIDEVLDRINKPAATKEDTPAEKPGLTAEQVAQMVEQTVTGRETIRQRESNLREADRLMKEKFGEKAAEVFKAKAATPELQKVFMELASQDPSQFVAVFAPAPVQTAAMDFGSVSGLALPAAGTNRANVEGTKEWAAKVRKENPTLYWSADFQYKLQNATIKNPSLYFGTEGDLNVWF